MRRHKEDGLGRFSVSVEDALHTPCLQVNKHGLRHAMYTTSHGHGQVRCDMVRQRTAPVLSGIDCVCNHGKCEYVKARSRKKSYFDRRAAKAKLAGVAWKANGLSMVAPCSNGLSASRLPGVNGL